MLFTKVSYIIFLQAFQHINLMITVPKTKPPHASILPDSLPVERLWQSHRNSTVSCGALPLGDNTPDDLLEEKVSAMVHEHENECDYKIMIKPEKV